MTVADVLLITIGAVVLGSALLVVTTRHLVRAGLWLIVTLIGVAAAYLVLTAEMVAWVQILLYLGAVVVLLLFAVMLTRAPIGVSDDLNRPRWPGALVGLGAAGALGALLVNAYRWEKVELPEAGTAERIGEQVFQSWVLPFELVGLLLLAALIGAIVLSQPGDDSVSGRKK
ncbi:MAG: NADH-quinone oxidoreductase subunit J [Micromonosporaceae bacterium]|nr:NADH-quinone oxidoreductase subunit J [Micromonosporaceae bacterium]